MTDAVWCDVAEFQAALSDAYPYRGIAFRSNDGTYRDRKFAANYAWAKSAVDRGLIDWFVVYGVYEPDGGAWASTLMATVGTPHPNMAVMIDVESWDGRIKGDHSADINAGVARLAAWLGSLDRVIGYGNAGDLNNLWPHKALAPNHLVYANYSGNPGYPGAFAHQYTSSGTVAPFGHPVDLNSADGMDHAAVAAHLGVAAPTPTPQPTPLVIPPIQGGNMFLVYDAQAAKAAGFTPGAGDKIQWILATVDGGQVRLLFLEDPTLRAVVLAARGDNAPFNIPIAGCDTATWTAFLAKEGYVYGQPVPLLDVNAALNLNDAQLQTLEQGVAQAIGTVNAAISDADKQAIAAAVRDAFTSNPLK